jgi:two-component system phosphate regulon sensor histidine kinase PhoR
MNLDLILQEKAAYTSELLDSLVSIDNSTIRLESLIKQYGFYLYKDQIYRPEMIELNALLQECIKILHEKAKDKGITISYDTNQMSTVFSDRAILQTILINLLDNAIKYNRQAGKVSIKTWAHQNGYEFSVEDNGIGISQEELPYIFDRFYRVDTSRSRKTGGSGLGLSIVKTLVKSASGTISIHSDIDKGTIVRFYIPNKDTIAV